MLAKIPLHQRHAIFHFSLRTYFPNQPLFLYILTAVTPEKFEMIAGCWLFEDSFFGFAQLPIQISLIAMFFGKRMWQCLRLKVAMAPHFSQGVKITA